MTRKVDENGNCLPIQELRPACEDSAALVGALSESSVVDLLYGALLRSKDSRINDVTMDHSDEGDQIILSVEYGNSSLQTFVVDVNGIRETVPAVEA